MIIKFANLDKDLHGIRTPECVVTMNT